MSVVRNGRTFRAAAALLGLWAIASPISAAAGAAQPRTVDEPGFATLRRMSRGVNVLGYDGIWSGEVDAPFRLATFRTIRAAGFDHVRINLFGFRYMDGQDRLGQTTLDALDRVFEAATAAGLVPVLDEHDYGDCQRDPLGCARRLKAFWRQVSARYAGRFPSAVFEILNEPGGAMSGDEWNRLSGDVLREIRATEPDRTVVVAAINSEDPAEASRLALPERDRNLIVTVHYYKPMAFTHQGAPWSPEFAAHKDVPWGSASDRAALESDFDVVARWAAAAHRPVYLGEFGVYDAAPLEARLRYLEAVTRAAATRGWGWACWQFDHDFALFDERTGRWNEPVVRALTAPRLNRRRI